MTFTLSALKRTLGGDKTRAQGQVPAVVYGGTTAPDSIAIDYPKFVKLYRAAGEASLIDLTVDGKDVGKVLIQAVQFDPVNDRVVHFDLRRIDMNKLMTATVELKFTGEPPVVKALGGTLVTNLTSVQVRCLPKDLVSVLTIDLSGLKTYEDVIKVKDVVLPAGVEIISAKENDLVAKANPALSEDELKALDAKGAAGPDLTKIETAGKKKEEDADAEAPAVDDKAKVEEKKPAEKK